MTFCAKVILNPIFNSIQFSSIQLKSFYYENKQYSRKTRGGEAGPHKLNNIVYLCMGAGEQGAVTSTFIFKSINVNCK